jgi:hypothetical protein
VKDTNLNISREVTRYLENVLYGVDTSDVQHQYTLLCEREKNLQTELTGIQTRKDELKTLLDKVDVTLKLEQDLYNRFVAHVNNRISSCTSANIPLDTRALCRYWKSDFFQDNGMKEQVVLDVLGLIDAGRFDFDCFQRLRRGDVLETS